MQAYRDRTSASSQPHVYMIAGSAFGAMMKGVYYFSIILVLGLKLVLWLKVT